MKYVWRQIIFYLTNYYSQYFILPYFVLPWSTLHLDNFYISFTLNPLILLLTSDSVPSPFLWSRYIPVYSYNTPNHHTAQDLIILINHVHSSCILVQVQQSAGLAKKNYGSEVLEKSLTKITFAVGSAIKDSAGEYLYRLPRTCRQSASFCVSIL